MPGFEVFDSSERNEVKDVLETGVLFRYGFDQQRKGIYKARTFEIELARKLGVNYCYLCSSGTAALNIALAVCGIGSGDEVIVPPFTFVATIEAVFNAGAIPIFSDIDETLGLCPKSLENAISPRTKAVLVVHMCGSMARIDEIKSFCDSKGLILIEDTCQAIGATFYGKSLGTFGRVGCFSFDPVKTITCGEGGAIITNDQALYLMSDAYADHGHDHVGKDRGLEGHSILGNNYRISELNAAVGLAQLRKLDWILKKQRDHKKILKDSLSKFSKISFRNVPDKTGDSSTFFSFFLPDESTARIVAKEFAQAGIDGCFYYYDNNWHYLRKWDHFKKLHSASKLPVMLFENRPDYENITLEKSDNIIRKLVAMLIKLSWTEKDLNDRVEKMELILKNLNLT